MPSKDTIIVGLIRKGMSLEEAEAFVADLPDDPEPPEEQPQQSRSGGGWQAGDAFQVRRGTPGAQGVAPRFVVAQRNPDGTTARQAAALDRGVRLCPNCQQGEDDHVPGCFRDPKNGFREDERRRARTAGQLPPIS